MKIDFSCFYSVSVTCPEVLSPAQYSGLYFGYWLNGQGVGFAGEFVVEVGDSTVVELDFIVVGFNVDSVAVDGNVGGGVGGE